MHHKKLNKWLQLGGHCDGESDCLSVAVREAHEESGLQRVTPVSADIFDIDIHLIPPRHSEPSHYHYDIRFLMRADSTAPLIQNQESIALRWVARDALHQLTTERSVTRMLDKTP